MKIKNDYSESKLDFLFKYLVKISAIFVLILLSSIIFSLIYSSLPSIERFGLGFLWNKEWNLPKEEFGAFVPIYGTIVSSIIALVISVPVSFGIALFLTELAPEWIKRPLGIAIELLAAIPSIVYGMWGLFFFAPFFLKYVQTPLVKIFADIPLLNQIFQGPIYGVGLLTAGIILAIMIIPYIASVMRDVFNQTPKLMKEPAYGLGATTWEVVWYIVLPYTKSGVIGGIILGLGRTLGETMAVTFVIGNTLGFSGISLFAPGNSITSILANEFNEAEPGLHTSALLELGLILFIITVIVLSISKIMTKRIGMN